MSSKRNNELERNLKRNKGSSDIVASPTHEESTVFPDEQTSSGWASHTGRPALLFRRSKMYNLNNRYDILNGTEVDPIPVLKNESDFHFLQTPITTTPSKQLPAALKDGIRVACTDTLTQSPWSQSDLNSPVSFPSPGEADGTCTEPSVDLSVEMSNRLSSSRVRRRSTDQEPSGSVGSIVKRPHVPAVDKKTNSSATPKSTPQAIPTAGNQQQLPTARAHTRDEKPAVSNSGIENHEPASYHQHHQQSSDKPSTTLPASPKSSPGSPKSVRFDSIPHQQSPGKHMGMPSAVGMTKSEGGAVDPEPRKRGDQQEQEKSGEDVAKEKINKQQTDQHAITRQTALDMEIQALRDKLSDATKKLGAALRDTQKRQEMLEAEVSQNHKLRKVVLDTQSELERAKKETESWKQGRQAEAKMKLDEERKVAAKIKMLEEDSRRAKAELQDARAAAMKEASDGQLREAQGVEQLEAVTAAATAFQQKICELEERVRRSGARFDELSKKQDEKEDEHRHQVSQLKEELQDEAEKFLNQQQKLANQREVASGLKAEVLRLQRDFEDAQQGGKVSQEETSSLRGLHEREQQISDLRPELATTSEALNTSEAKGRQLSDQVSRLETELSRTKDDNLDFQKDLDDEKIAAAELTRILENVERNLAGVNREKSDLEQHSTRLEQQLAKAQGEAADLRQSEAVTLGNSESLQEELDRLRLKAEGSTEETSKLTGQLERQNKELVHGRGQYDELAQKLSERDQQIEPEAKLSGEEISGLKEQLKDKDSELEQASQLAKDLASREQKMRRQLKYSEQETSGLVQRLKELERKQRDLATQERTVKESADQRQSDLEKEIQGLRSQVKDLLDREQTAKSSLQELTDASKKEGDKLREQLQRSRDRVTTFEAEAAELGRHLEEARNKVQSLEEASSQARDIEHSLQKLQEELQRSQDGSRHHMKGCQERDSAHENELSKLQSQLEHSQGVSSELETKLKNSTQRNRDLDDQVRTLTTRLQAEIQSQRTEKHQWESLITDARRDAGVERKRADVLTGQLQQLKQATEAVKSQLESQRLQILDLNSLLEKYQAEAAKLAADKSKLKVEVETGRKTIEILKTTNQDLASGFRDGASQQLMRQIEQGREEVAQLSSKIEEQESQLKIQDAFIAQVQTVAWERVKEAAKEKNIVIDDDELAAKFQVDVESRAQQWAEKYAVRESELEWTSDSMPAMGKELEKVTGIVQRDAVGYCSRYELDLVVHALLSRFVTDHILQNPFLLFQLQAGTDFVRLMNKLYQAKLTDDPPTAHKWRYSQLLWLGASSQSNPAKPSPAAIPDILQQNNPTNKAYFSNLAHQFVNGPIKLLLNERAFSNSGIQTIVCLLRNAAQAAFLMWRQPMEIQIREFGQLKRLQYPLADDGTGVAETHRRQTGPGALAARRTDAVIDMVVQPAIIGLRDNGTEKVWSRGVVLWN